MATTKKQIEGNVTGWLAHTESGEHQIHRCVATRQRQEVYDWLGHEDDVALQGFLDGCAYCDYFDSDGKYLGPDEFGLGLRFGD